MLLKAWRQPLRSSASASQVSMSMPVSSRSRLQTSLTRSAGRPIGRHPVPAHHTRGPLVYGRPPCDVHDRANGVYTCKA